MQLTDIFSVFCWFVFSTQMATVERNPGRADGEQKENVSPPGEDSPLVFNKTSAPLNFFELTPCQFDISVQSFTPAASSNRKGDGTWSGVMLNYC